VVKIYPVGSKNSCGLTLIIFQQSSQPFATLNGAFTFWILTDCRKEEHVAFTLMIALVMEMFHVLCQSLAERLFPKEDEPRQALPLDRAHLPFREGALGLSRGRRQWATPSVLLRLQALLILRACPSGQTLVPSGSALGRLGQHDGVWAQSAHAGLAGWVVCNLL
jgi:hypothetical protein